MIDDIGWVPVLPQMLAGPAAIPAVAAIGILVGFCGTLSTPMAANFNLVSAALLDLEDRNSVIRAQAPTAPPPPTFNIVPLWAVMP